MSLGAELHATRMVRANLERDVARVVDEHPIALVGQIERHVLVGLFGIGAAVFVPHVELLAVLDECAEMLAETVDRLAGLER